MRGLTLIERWLNAPGPLVLAAIVGAGLLAIVVSLVLLASVRARSFLGVLGLGLAGLVLAELGMWAVLGQTMTTRSSPIVTAIRPRYSHEVRTWAWCGVIGLPLVFGVGVRLVAKVAARRDKAEVPALVQEGVRHLVQGDYDAAVLKFSAAIQRDPRRADLYIKRGTALQQQGELDLALADFERALARDPELAEAYLCRGVARATVGDVDLALSDFERVLASRPDDIECLLQRGLCLAKKGDASQAILALERVLRLTNHPEFAEPAQRALRELGASPNSLPRGPLA